MEVSEAVFEDRAAAEVVRANLPRLFWKRMRSGDRPGLQNRRAAGFLSPVGSTPTRFRHLCQVVFESGPRLFPSTGAGCPASRSESSAIRIWRSLVHKRQPRFHLGPKNYDIASGFSLPVSATYLDILRHRCLPRHLPEHETQKPIP